MEDGKNTDQRSKVLTIVCNALETLVTCVPAKNEDQCTRKVREWIANRSLLRQDDYCDQETQNIIKEYNEWVTFYYQGNHENTSFPRKLRQCMMLTKQLKIKAKESKALKEVQDINLARLTIEGDIDLLDSNCSRHEDVMMMKRPAPVSGHTSNPVGYSR